MCLSLLILPLKTAGLKDYSVSSCEKFLFTLSLLYNVLIMFFHVINQVEKMAVKYMEPAFHILEAALE